MKKIIFTIICSFIVAISVAQVMSLNGTALVASGGSPSNCSAGGFKTLNSANVSGNCVTFTTGGFQNGAIWACSPIDLNQSFKLNFTINFGSNAAGGDGMAFLLQTEGVPQVIGGRGGGLGYAQGDGAGCQGGTCPITPSVAVEFDTWNNTVDGLNDLACNHSSIQTNGIMTSSNTLSGPTCLKSGGASVVDGLNHDVCITWNPSLNRYIVFFDGVQIINYNGNIRTLFSNPSAVFWGFTGASGGAAQTQSICSVNMLTNLSSPSCSCTPINISNITTNVNCNGGSNGTINITPSGGVSPYTFIWNGGVTTEDRNGLLAGVYSVTVTDLNGCTNTNSATITQPSAITASNIVTNVLCNGTSSGAINLTASGGTGTLSYNWGSGITTEDRSGLAAGTYTVTITDANACTFSNSANITQPSAITASNIVTNVLCNGTSSGAINLTASGGTGTLNYNWGSGITTEDRIGLSAGTYTVTITDANACTFSNSATITQPSAITASNIVTNVLCNGTSSGAINLTASGGTGTLNYNWGSGITTEDRSGLVAGTYTVTITDANACTATSSATITSVPGLSIVPNPNNISCFGGSNGVAAVTVSGGSGTYSYNWSNGATTSAISGLAAGNYTVTVNSGSSGSTTDTLYRQDFSGVHNWTLNVNTGTNSATPQTWTVNAQEGGVLPPGCGVANNGNNTLHITCTSLFCGSLITGAVYNATQQTNRRAESPVFSTVGYTGLTLRFNYISLGDGLLDNASVLYNDGSGWQVLNPSIKSLVCGSGQGQWTAFSATLPASCNNNPNVRIGFNWTNNNDNIGTDPSIAVDNILITSPGTGGAACSGVQTVTVTQPSIVNVANVQETCNTLNGTFVLEFDVNGGTAPYTVTGISGSFSGNHFTSNSLSGAQSYTITDSNNCQLPLNASGTCSSSVSSCNFTNGCFNNNLLANSDFENYNPANPFQFFTSGFTPNNTNGTCTPGANCNGSFLCQGGFAISNNPTPCNPTWPSNIRDHTTGTGNMMLVDFPNTGSIPVWCQNVNLAPNTNYCFGAWFINLLPAGSNQGLPQFRYTINGISFDTTAFLQEDERWHFYGVQFNSGLGGPTDICIFNQNAGFVGFDLAIDDISLRVITNGTLPQISNDTVRTCAGRAVSFNPTLNDAGAPGNIRILTPPAFTTGSASISGNNITFTPVAGFADTTTMEYELCVSGCCSSAVVTLIVNPNPNATLAISTNSICLGDSASLTAGPSSSSYNWSLNGTQFLTGSNNQISVGNSGTYTVVVTDNNSCSATSNAVLLNNVSPLATLNGPAVFCSPSTGAYTASGGDFYTFSLNGAIVQNNSTNNTYNSTVLNDGDRLVVQVCRGLLYDGFINESVWGSPLATSAGGPAPGFGSGHEINAIYGGVSADSIYIAVAGNVQNNNRILVFIDSKTGGYSNGNFGRNAAPQGVDDFNSGTNFDAGFLPDYCMVIGTDATQTNFFWDLYELSGTAGSGGGPNNFLGDLSSNRLHASPLNSSQTRGFESGISKAELGMTGNSFSMMAMYSSDAGFLSNQFMTPAGSGDGNYTNGVVDFAQAAPNPITVSAFLNNCCAFDTIDIDVSSPSLTVSSTNVTCNGQANGTATVSVSGASNPISFLWSNGASTASVNGLGAGTYSVTVTANGCSASSAVTITQAPATTVSSVSTNASCFGNNGSINLTVSGGTSPYTYAWSNGATSEDLTGLAVGSYTVNVRDANACNIQSTIVVNSNSATTVTVDSVANVSCNGGNNGAVNISAQAQSVPCSSPVIRINEILSDVSGGLAAGDGSGCGSATNPLSAEFIELIGPPGANIGCFVLTDGDWTITIPPGTTIPSDGIFTIGNNNTPLHQTNGTVFDLNANSCQCFTDSCQLLIFTNGGEYLAIFNSAGTFVDGLIYGTPSVANTPVAGTVIPTRGLVGCVNSVTIPAISSFVTSAQPAEGNTISRIPDGNGAFTATPANTPNACNFTAPPVLTYQWSNGATTQDISGLPAGVYTVTVLDPQGCPTIRVATVTEPSAISTTTSSTLVSCFGGTDGTASVSASGGIAPYTFLWSNGSTASLQNNLSAGVYSVTTSDANSCRLISTVSVSQASAISVTALPLDIACSSSNIGAVNLSLSGGTGTYSFQWSNGATSQNISGLSAGNYAVTITDANNCQSFVSATVSSTPGLQLIATGTNISCNGGNNGCVEVLVNGGTAPYSYLWSNGSTVDSVCGLAPGTYIVTVTDNGGGGLQNDTIYQEGFQATHNWTLNVPTGTNGADNNFWTVSDAEAGVLPNGCGTSGNGDRTLHITSVFNPTGGAAYDAGGLCGLLFCPQTNMRAESPSFSTIGFTNLSLSFDFISQGDGLIDNASVLYNDGSGWNVLANSIKSGCCGGPCSGFNQGQWTAFNVALPASCNNNPNVRVAVNWTNNDDGVGTDPSVAINNVLVYRTNSGGTACTGTDTITITQPAALVSNTVSITNANCSTPGAINITVGGGTAPYSFVWSNGASTEDISGLAAGSYSVTITDANGCSAVNAANTVNSSGQPQPSVNNSVNPSCNNSNDGSVSLTITNGTAPYSFIWNSGQTTQNLSGLGGGNYSVTVSDALGCTASISVSLTEPSAIQATITTVPADCNNSNASIDVLASGGAGAPYSFVWQNAATSQNLIGLSSGNYAVTIEDANGCTIVENITIATPLIPQLSAFIGQSGIVDSSIVLGESIEVNAGNNQSSQGVVYQWTALPGSANLVNDTSFATNVSPDPAGFYTMIITATSADGCTSTDTLTLTVNPASDPKIPNAFSPNNDGTNDIFRVVDLDVQYLKEFKVYNRWGQLLYDNLQGSWDGTFNGTEQPRDTYLYIISWQLPSDPNPVLNRGTVTLLR